MSGRNALQRLMADGVKLLNLIQNRYLNRRTGKLVWFDVSRFASDADLTQTEKRL